MTTKRSAAASARPAEFSSADFFAVRTPLLPLSAFIDWGSELEAPSATGDLERLRGAIYRDEAKLRERLRTLIGRAHVREALFVASPALHGSIGLWDEHPESERGQKVERSLVRYFSRMTARPTPFGLFAGCSVGTIGEVTRLEVDSLATYRRHTRLDMEYVCALVDDLVRIPAVRRELTYGPNSTLHKSGDRLRYAEQRLDDRARSYHLVAVKRSDYLDVALGCAASGSSMAQMAHAVATIDHELEPGEAEEFVEELIDSQIVIPDLLPAVTGPEPLGQLIQRLGELRPLTEVATKLSAAAQALERLDAYGVQNSPTRYEEIAIGLEPLGTKVDLPRLFQVDLVKPLRHETLGRDVIDAVADLVSVLHRLGPGPEGDLLSEFRDEFSKRYEGREIPLLQALDEETGIGFKRGMGPGSDASPLLSDLPFPVAPDGTIRLGPRERLLVGKLERAVRSGAKEIVLEESDLVALERVDKLPLPSSFCAMVTVVARSPEALAAGEFRLLAQGCAGPSGAIFLGRFCHADPQLDRCVREYLRQEEACDPQSIFAEVVHLPEGRVGNVISRPVLREYEIPFLGKSGAPPERQISVSELTLSVVNGRLILRSPRLGRDIIPRLTNAHTFENSELVVYRFLCSLAKQGTAPWRESIWGNVEASFYPRISIGRFILSRATWRIDRPGVAFHAERDRESRYIAVQQVRSELGLPRFVFLSDGDNLLPIDLDNAFSIASLIQLTKGRDFVRLEEFFPGPNELCISGPDGLFVHELVVPFRTVTSRAPAPRSPARPTATNKRYFFPGSEWLYLKAYCGPVAVDQILRNVIGPLSDRIAELTESWFFIRYADPDWHIRLRFSGSSKALYGALLPELMAAMEPLLHDESIRRVQLDTYEREIERYGGPEGISLAEQLFHEDTRAVLRIVQLLEGDEGLNARWQLALRGMDLLLDDLGFDVQGKLDLLGSLRDAFAREFKIDGSFARALSAKFRRERPTIDALFDPAQEEANLLAPGIAILRRRSRNIETIATEMVARQSSGLLSGSMLNRAASLLHMHANRMLRSNARAQELVLYDFLSRVYESQLARGRAPRGSSNEGRCDGTR